MSITLRRRPAVITAGALGTAALALATSGTLSAFTASITNSTNTGGVGTLAMRETGVDATGATVTCETTATTTSTSCATINKYGGDVNMNTTTNAVETRTVTIANTGTMDAGTFTLTPGDCTPSTSGTAGTVNTGLCTEAIVTITQDGTQVFRGTPAALKAAGSLTLATTNVKAAPATTTSSTFTISFDTTGATNATQGQQVSQPLTWTFNA